MQQFVGAGPVLFFGFDETWRWRLREDELQFNQFWIQTVRYLARSRLGRIDLRLDRQTPYRRGEPIKMTVRFPDDAPPPAADGQVKVIAQRTPPRPGGPPQEAEGGVLAPLLFLRPAYIVIANRTRERAVALVSDFSDLGPLRASGFDDLPAEPFDLVINATSASLSGEIPAILRGCAGRKHGLLRHGLRKIRNAVCALGARPRLRARAAGFGHAGGTGRGIF